MSSIYIEDYNIKSPNFNVNTPKKFLIASDIHFNRFAPKELYESLIKYAGLSKPDYILMPGDLIENFEFINTKNDKKYFEYILRSLSEVAPVIFSCGNHDIGSFASDNLFNKNKKIENNLEAKRFFESLNKHRNIYYLDNCSHNIGGINFTGFDPNIQTYGKTSDKDNQVLFILDFIDSQFKIKKDDYNVLLCHNPLYFSESLINCSIKDLTFIDLIVSGHLHNGYMPKFLDKYVNNKFGFFFCPFISPIPGSFCRGINDYNRGYLFVSKGFRKFSADDLMISRFADNLYAKDLEEITIVNGEKEKEKVLVKKYK